MNFTLKDILSIIFRYKNGLFLFTLYLCLGFAIFMLFSKRMYESNAQILVRFGQEQLGTSTLSSADRNIYYARREQEIQNEIRILISNDTLTAVAQTIVGPEASQKNLLKVREYLRDNLEASALKDSDVLTVSFLFPDPAAAQRVLAAIVDQYRLHHGAVYFNTGELDLISGKMDSSRQDYAQALETLSAFEAKFRLYDERQIMSTNEIIEEQRVLLNNLMGEHAYTVQKRDLIRDALAEVPQNVLFSVREVRNATYERLNERMSELLMQRQAFLARYNPDSRTVQDMDKEIGLLTSLLEDQPQRLIDDKETRTNETWSSLNQALQDLNPEVEAQRARIDLMTTQIEQMEASLTSAVTAKGKHALLTREVALKKEIYDRYYQNYTEAIGREAAQQQSITNITVVEQPSLEVKAAKPKIKRVAALGLAALIAGNIFVLFVSFFVDNTLSSPEQAERALKYPVVGVFNALMPRKILSGRNGSRGQPQEETPGYERNRKEFRHLYLKTIRFENKVSLLFSSSERDGRLNALAVDFAVFTKIYQQRQPVIISYYPEEIYMDKTNGRSEIYSPVRQIEGIDEYVLPDNVDMASELAFWDKLKTQHDLLVFNYAPLQESPLLIGLADKLDWVIQDIQAEKTNRYVASSAIDSLAQFGFKKIGLLLSERRFHIPTFLYRYL